MTRSVFITGTDTEVGKTWVSERLIAQLVATGRQVSAFKPVAAGCEQVVLPMSKQEQWCNEDALRLQQASNVNIPYEWVNPYPLKQACAPHLAAQTDQVQIEPLLLLNRYECLCDNADVCVVEGAGGWRVPLADDFSTCDLAKLLQAPVVLVVGMRLGCINHALLSAEAILADGLPCLGWVANVLPPEQFRLHENIATLQALMPVPHLATVGVSTMQDKQNWQALVAAVMK